MFNSCSASSYHAGGYMALPLPYTYSLCFVKSVKHVLARSVLVLPCDVPVWFVFQNK